MASHSNNFDTHIGDTHVHGAHIVIVYTQWNKQYIDELLKGAHHIFNKHTTNTQLTLLEVPGCIEIPFAIHAHCSKHYNTDKGAAAYIAFGIVLKGETAHFDYVCNSVTDGITHLNVTQAVPTIYGILTVNTIAQITDRLGGVHGHKGEEAAITALRMITLNKSI